MAYIYAAAIYCDECGATLCSSLKCPGDPYDEGSYDSSDYPKGPYGDGGGEADCPQHCGDCGEFLENPLTKEGLENVRRAALDPMRSKIVAEVWAPFYGVELD